MPRRKADPDYFPELVELDSLVRAAIFPTDDPVVNEILETLRAVLPRLLAAAPKPPPMSESKHRKLTKMIWLSRERGNGQVKTWPELAERFNAQFGTAASVDAVRAYWRRYQKLIGKTRTRGKPGRPKNMDENRYKRS